MYKKTTIFKQIASWICITCWGNKIDSKTKRFSQYTCNVQIYHFSRKLLGYNIT